MRDNMIVNLSGHAGKAAGIDIHIEHLIKADKVCADTANDMLYGPFALGSFYLSWGTRELGLPGEPLCNFQSPSFFQKALWSGTRVPILWVLSYLP